MMAPRSAFLTLSPKPQEPGLMHSSSVDLFGTATRRIAPSSIKMIDGSVVAAACGGGTAMAATVGGSRTVQRSPYSRSRAS